jgi:hypothetical protein
LKILHPICLKFAVIFLLFCTAAWSRQRQPRYPNLLKLALAVACVVLQNSNADSERILSMLKKIQTEHRAELANDTIWVYAHLTTQCCKPLKPSMREISAMTAEGEILHERHFQPKDMTCTLYTSTKHQ